jgi:hypothetical protein
MYLASLNIDWFFKKVFSDKRIAKSFLQDLFNVKITEITLIGTDYKLSDDAVIVRFDFRCKIRGKYVQIEMQQKYKPDVNKRFYVYHCINTAVQLEMLEPIVTTKANGETYTEKNYDGIEPVITVIWMVDDTLKFKDDIIAFTTLPEAAKDFIMDSHLWQQPMEVILAEREKTLKILNNKSKDLDFFSKNRLIYAFQQNIFRNKKNTSYFKWFDLAQKSKNPNNIEQDFSKYKKNRIMVEVIKRLKRDQLQPDELKIANYIEQFNNSWAVTLAKKDKEIERAEKRAEKAEKAEKEKQEKLQIEQEKLQIEQEKLQIEQEKLLKAIKAFLALGKDIPYISDILDTSIEEITILVAQIKAKKD